MSGGSKIPRSTSCPDISRDSSQRSLGGSRSPKNLQRALQRNNTDLTANPSCATYELRPQVLAGSHGGQLVARSPHRKPTSESLGASPKASRPSPADQLLAAVDEDVKAAATMLELERPREAVELLQRAFRKTVTTGAGTGTQPVMLARASVHLELARLYSFLTQHRQALEEAVGAMLEADAAWQAMLSAATATSSPTSGVTEAPVPEVALRVLLQNPPPWLQRTAETSVLARCCAATILQAAAVEGSEVAIDEAKKEADGLLQEAVMLARHFLPSEHPARTTTEVAIESLPIAPDATSSGAAPDSVGHSALFSGLSEAEILSWKEAKEYQLPGLKELQKSRRLPSREDSAQASRFTGSPPASAQGSVTFQDQGRELFTPPSPAESLDAPQAPAAFRATAPPVAWTGRCPAGDVYVSSLPKSKLPRLSGTGRKSKKTVVAVEPTAGQKKRAEGVAGGLSRSAASLMTPEAPPPDAFQDWLSSFDDPTRHDIKRQILRSDEAAQRFKSGLKNESQYFKARVLGEASEEELMTLRIRYSGYGIRAAKIAEKRAVDRGKEFGVGDSDEMIVKKQTRHDLFKFYKVDPGKGEYKKGEPGMKTLGKLLYESEPGRERGPKRLLTKQEQLTKDMQAMFGSSSKKDEPATDKDVNMGLSASFKKSASANTSQEI